MNYHELSVDPRGEWSPVQARRVLAIVNAQAYVHGIEFVAIEITTMNSPYRRMLLVAHCIEHHVSVAHNTVCMACKRHVDRLHN